MKISNSKPSEGLSYETPAMILVYFDMGFALCETSAEGGEIQPGTLDPWGNF